MHIKIHHIHLFLSYFPTFSFQDGTLLDTESLADQAIIESFGSELSQKYKNEFQGRLPWEIKSKILGLRGSEWIPMVLTYAESNWEVNIDTLCHADPDGFM